MEFSENTNLLQKKNKVESDIDKNPNESHHFKIETLGGDASLLHLASQIDRGIKRKMREKESAKAKNFRIWHKRLNPLKFMTLFIYVTLTQWERPDWCLDIILEKNQDPSKYQNFNEWYCNEQATSKIKMAIFPKVNTPAPICQSCRSGLLFWSKLFV